MRSNRFARTVLAGLIAISLATPSFADAKGGSSSGGGGHGGGGGRGGSSSTSGAARSTSPTTGGSASRPATSTTTTAAPRTTTTTTTTTARTSTYSSRYVSPGGMYGGWGMGYGYSNGLLTGMIIGGMMHPHGTVFYTGPGIYGNNAVLYNDGRVVNRQGVLVGTYIDGVFTPVVNGGVVAQTVPSDAGAQPVIVVDREKAFWNYVGYICGSLVLLLFLIWFLGTTFPRRRF